MNCPICGKQTGSTSVLTYFNAHCSNGHSYDGSFKKYHNDVNKQYDPSNIKLISTTEHVRINRRKFCIVHWIQEDNIEIRYDTQWHKPKKTLITLPKEDFESKYRNNKKALKQLVENAETFK